MCGSSHGYPYSPHTLLSLKSFVFGPNALARPSRQAHRRAASSDVGPMEVGTLKKRMMTERLVCLRSLAYTRIYPFIFLL